MKSTTIIKTEHLTKRFKKITAVDELNLLVHRGDIFGFLGPNGAGKSTTIRILLDLVRPTNGDVRLFDLPLQSNRKKILIRVGALVERPDFYSYLTGKQNLTLFSKMLGEKNNSRIEEVLELVKLKDRANDKVKSYSHGMKQRLGIAQALLGKPELIILDEPTTGLDPEGMKEIRELILNLAQQDITIFLSSHLLHEVEQICNKMAVINRGKLIIQGSVQELLRNGPMILHLEVDRMNETMEKLDKLPYVKRVMREPPSLKIEMMYDKIPELNRFLVEQEIRVYRLHPQTSLEDYYLSLVRN